MWYDEDILNLDEDENSDEDVLNLDDETSEDESNDDVEQEKEEIEALKKSGVTQIYFLVLCAGNGK